MPAPPRADRALTCQPVGPDPTLTTLGRTMNTADHRPATPIAADPASPTGRGLRGPDRMWHLAFGTLGAITLIAFTIWSVDYVGPGVSVILLITAILFGLFMSFNIGGNDVANSFGTSVGAGTLTMKQALLVAAVFEVSGALLAGGAVTDTVRSGIVDLDAIHLEPMDFVVIMMAALLGAALWLLIATRMGWPVSTTHAIVGGIVGAAVSLGLATGSGGLDMVQWSEIVTIAISWVLSPLLGGLVAWWLFGAINRRILRYNRQADESLRRLREESEAIRVRHKEAYERLDEIQRQAFTSALASDALTSLDEDIPPEKLNVPYYRELHDLRSRARDVAPHRALQIWVPVLAAGGAVVISAMLLFKGMKNLDLQIGTSGAFLIMGMIAVAVWMAVSVIAKSLRGQDLERSTFVLFSWMQVFTASAFAFSHGSNDIANAIGPFAAVLDVLRTNQIGEKAVVPGAAMLAFGIALVVGLWFVGRRVIATVGTNLTRIHPASGFAAELAAAGVVMGASVLGLPVSSTHILIGAVLGVGLVNHSANWKLMKPIALAWVITLPASATIGAVGVLVLRAIF